MIPILLMLVFAVPDAGVGESRSARPTVGQHPKAHDDPWSNVPSKYPVGTKTKGKVVSVLKSGLGIFIELEPSVEVLVHHSDLPAGKKPKDFQVGQTVDLTVISVDTGRRRIGGAME